MFAGYFYRGHTATIAGSQQRRERYVVCSRPYQYTITRTAQGGAGRAILLPPLAILGVSGSQDVSRQRARQNLRRMLNEDVESAHCPNCGNYQPAMVREPQRRLGKRCDPNRYAAERIAIPIIDAWHAACKAHTVESYAHFKDVWPTAVSVARQQIKSLRYPRVKKLAARAMWGV